MTRKGCRIGKRYGTGLIGRTQEHSKLRVDVNLTVYLKPVVENKGPDLPKGSGYSRFGGNKTQIDPASEQHDPKPYNFLLF